VLVVAPADLIAGKVIAYHQRRGQPKSGTDWRDVAMLLLTFPELKRDPGRVRDCLLAAGAAPACRLCGSKSWLKRSSRQMRTMNSEGSAPRGSDGTRAAPHFLV
jgi:hypothetical protein